MKGVCSNCKSIVEVKDKIENQDEYTFESYRDEFIMMSFHQTGRPRSYPNILVEELYEMFKQQLIKEGCINGIQNSEE